MKILGKWKDDLIWCPSQCYLLVEIGDKQYTLYLRWRHQDPWQGHIIEGSLESLSHSLLPWWSPDLFVLYHERYSDEELDLAKEALIRLADKFVAEGKLKGGIK